MEEPTPISGGARWGVPLGSSEQAPPAQQPRPKLDPPETDPSRSPEPGWPPWSAPIALLGGLVLAAVAGLLLDIPAALIFGVTISNEHLPAGLSIADTLVQEVGFVLAAVYCAQIGGRVVRSWQFGLRPPGVGWRSAAGGIVVLGISFLALSAAWSAIFHPEEETLLKSLGSNEGTTLLLLSAALTCVAAPIAEEFLFRGYVFTALRGWRGTLPAALITGLLFGGVHYGSAPALDLVPLAGLGFGLCLLYRHTGSLYPCIVAHSLNNSVAFASLEDWSWQAPVLIVGSLLAIAGIAILCRRAGLIAPPRRLAAAAE